MKKLFEITLIVATSFICIFSANLSSADIIWTKQFGTTLEDQTTGIGVDNSGNVYVVGWTIGVLPGQSAFGDIDSYITKYNSNGELIWTRQFGTTMGDRATDVAVTGEGIAYVVGSTGGTFPGQTNYGQHDSFIRKYDSAGNEMWTRQFGTDNQEEPLGVNLDSIGNVYIVGRITGFFPGQESYVDTDAFITRYNSTGELLWTRQFGTPDEDVAWDVLVDYEANRIYVVGYTYGEFPNQTNLGYGDGFLSTYDMEGNVIWTSQFGTSHLDVATSLALSSDGEIYVVGQLNGSFVAKFDISGNKLWLRPFWGYANRMAIDENTGNLLITGSTRYGGIPGQTGAGGQDAFITKCDSEVNEIITWQFGTGGGDSADDIIISPSGSIYIIGNVNGSLPDQNHLGGTDPFVMRLSDVPVTMQSFPVDINWAIQLGTNSDEEAYAIGADDDGNVYVTGSIYGEFPGFDNNNLGGGWEAFVSKWSNDGKRRWTLQFGTGMGTLANDMAVDQAGNQYIVGSTGGALPGQINSGAPDAFLRKYDTNGHELWTRQFGTESHDEAIGVKIDKNNNVYVAWISWEYMGGQSYINKYDANGYMIWSKQLADITEPVSFAIDSQGNFYLSGITNSALPGQTYQGDSDAYVRKYDSSGNEIWTRQFGTTYEDHALAVNVDNQFNVYVAGRTDSAFPGQTFEGMPFDAFIRKYSSNGTEEWTDQFGAIGDQMDEIRSIAIDSTGDVYVTGAFGPDALVRKYNSNGEVLWSRQIGGGIFADYSQNLSLTKNGKLLVAGFTYGSFLDQNYFGSKDAFFFKMDASPKNFNFINIVPILNLLLD